MQCPCYLSSPPKTPIFFQDRGSPECAFCTPLCTVSVLTYYALTDKKTSKWQDSTLCILPLGPEKNKKKKQKTCPQCLQSLERCHFKFQRVCSRIWVTLSAAYCRYTADHRIDADVCMCRPVGDSHFSITSISQTLLLLLLLLLLDSFYGESSPPLTKTMWVEALIWNIGEFGIVWPEASPNHLQTINYN